MATLNTTHDGLERILRGWNHPESAAQQALGLRGQAIRTGSWLSRALDQWRRRLQDERFEDAMRRDPRISADLRAAMDRREW